MRHTVCGETIDVREGDDEDEADANDPLKIN